MTEGIECTHTLRERLALSLRQLTRGSRWEVGKAIVFIDVFLLVLFLPREQHKIKKGCFLLSTDSREQQETYSTLWCRGLGESDAECPLPPSSCLQYFVFLLLLFRLLLASSSPFLLCYCHCLFNIHADSLRSMITKRTSDQQERLI